MRLTNGNSHTPKRSRTRPVNTIQRFFHRLEKHKLNDQLLAAANNFLIELGLLLGTGTVVNATLMTAFCSTKNDVKGRATQMHFNDSGKPWHFGMKAHTGADADSGLEHSVRDTTRTHARP